VKGGIVMASSVPTYEKKNFIKWFLKNYQLKRREGVWILNYLLTDDHLLEKVHFVEEAHYCPRAIVMSSVDSHGIPFRYYKGNVMTNDAEKSFHDLRMNGKDHVFIQLNFPNIPPHMNYIAVLEHNPHIPHQSVLTEHDRLTAEAMLDDSLYQYQQQKIYDEIDAALDVGDKELFLQLSNKLQQMQYAVQNEREKKDGI
jgi:uncharacterized protein YpiB (UPF0302 family)